MSYMDIIMVNFRQPQLTIDCLASLAEERKQLTSFTVWLCENGSGDNSYEVLQKTIEQKGWQEWVELVNNSSNDGFSGGNNLLIERVLNSSRVTQVDAHQHLVFLLNNDTIVRPGALACLVTFMQQHPHADACASRLEYPDATVQCSAFRFPSLLSEIESSVSFGPVSRLLARYKVAPEPQSQPHTAEWVAGASLLVRRSVLQRVGLLDHGFWTYFEDVDFCKRLQQQHFSLWYVPDARIVHLVGASSGVTADNAWKKARPAYWYHARRRYFLKHHGFFTTLVIDAAELFGAAFGLLLRRIRGLPPHKPRHYLRDFWRYSAWRQGPRLPVVEAPK